MSQKSDASSSSALKTSGPVFWVVLAVVTISLALFVLPVGGRRGAKYRPEQTTSTRQRQTTPALRSRIQANYAALPLAFEQNQGQTDRAVKYTARANGYTLFLTENEAVFSLAPQPASQGPFDRLINRPKSVRQTGLCLGSRGEHCAGESRYPKQRSAKESSTAVMHMQLVGADSSAEISAMDKLPGKANYFIGSNPSKWRSNVPLYSRVSYQDVYPGVNLVFHGEGRRLEFDLVVAPEASAAPIALRFTDAQKIKTDDSGNLHISSAAGDVVLHKPFAYQWQNGAKTPVDAQFALSAGNRVSFALGNYDRSRELVIDPSLTVSYATYLGGSGADEAEAITFDSSGNAYVTGQTASTNFPGASGTNMLTGAANVFVTEMNSSGSNFVYSTYVGGTGTDAGYGIALDKTGDVFVVGGTSSTDFPHTSGAYQTMLPSGASSNAFIFELNSAGALTYGTYFGGSGSDVAVGMAFDQATGVYAVVGSASSTDFPVKNALQSTLAGTSNGFVSLWNSTGNALTFSTYLGGASGDIVNAAALDSADNVYVTGKTSSPSFPTTTGAFQTKCGSDGTCNGGLTDAFATEIDSAGSKYVFSTFLGGSNNDLGDGVAVDSTGVYITGQTESTDFPVVAGGFQSTFAGSLNNAFVTKLNSTGSKEVFSSFLGGTAAQIGASIAVDGGGNAYISGQTDSTDFPLANPTQPSPGGGEDAFVTEVNSPGSKLLFSTYLGGSLDEDDGGNYGAIAVDTYGANIYVAGNTESSNFPTFPNPGAYQTTFQGGSTDAFVAKFAQPSFGIAAAAPTPSPVSPGSSATSTVTLTSFNGYASPVNLSCTVTGTGSPLPTCGFSTSSVTPTVSGAATTLTISVPVSSGAVLPPRKFDYATWLPTVSLSLVGISFVGLFFVGSIWPLADPRCLRWLACGMIATAGLLLLPACGGNSSVTGSLNCTTAPSAPTGLAASSTTSTGTTLNWTAAAVGANCSVTGYTVYENGKSIGTPTATTFNVTGLTAATMYSFTVAASDSTGLSAQSSAISVTTGPGGTPTGTYTVTITGIGSDANTTTQMATTTLTVN